MRKMVLYALRLRARWTTSVKIWLATPQRLRVKSGYGEWRWYEMNRCFHRIFTKSGAHFPLVAYIIVKSGAFLGALRVINGSLIIMISTRFQQSEPVRFQMLRNCTVFE